jgi:hypothetical protein
MARTIVGINISRLVLESSGFDEGLFRVSISIGLSSNEKNIPYVDNNVCLFLDGLKYGPGGHQLQGG